MFLDWFHYLLDTNVFLILFLCACYDKTIKIYIFKSTYTPSLLTSLCDGNLFSLIHTLHPPLPLLILWLFSILPSLFSPSSLPTGIVILHSHTPPHPHPTPTQSPLFSRVHRLVCLCWINLPLAKLLLDYVFFPFSQCNPFKLLPQQLIKHSNKTSICPPFPTPCPSPVSVKWWMAAKSGRQLWCNDTTAMASPTPPPTPRSPSEYVSAWGSLTKHKYKWNITLN